MLMSLWLTAQTPCQLTAPVAGSSWIAGATMTINWNTTAFTTNVNLVLIDYTGGGAGNVVLSIAGNIANSGTYNWVIPNTLPSKCVYGVYVENVGKTNWCYGPANICIRKSNCDASFSFAPIGNCGNFQFTNTSVSPGLDRPGYSWNFGDSNSGANNTSTAQNPTHQFSACGIYNVCTTVTGTGCTSTICNTVTVSDITPPVARCKPGVGVILDANCQYNVTSAFVDNGSTDNCQIKSLVVNPAILFGCGNTTVTLTVTDWCNNKSTCTMGIQTIETVPPIITCPPTATVTCTKDTIPSVTGTATATDNCPGVITFTHSDIVSGNFPCDATIRRTWTATDACGNSSTCFQTIIVRDNVPPIITNCPTSQTVGTNAGVCYYTFPTPLVITATDCDPNPVITCTWTDPNGVVSPLTAQTQFPKGVNSIKCTARDKCGNVSKDCFFTLTVVDNQPPTITCPLSISVVGSIVAPSTLCKATVNGIAPIVTDNCPMWNVTYTVTGSTIASGSTDASGTMFMQGISTVTYTVTDMGGNKATCSFTINVKCVPCLASFTYAISGSCNNIQFTNQSGGTPPLTYIWTFGDPNSGTTNNTSTAQNPIHQFTGCGAYNVCLYLTTGDGCRDTFCRQIIIDNTAPNMTCPANMTVACIRDTATSITGKPVVFDNCSGTVTVTYSDVITGTLPCNGIIKRTWTARDFCGNTATCVQTITVNDITPPNIVCPQSYTVNTNAGVCYYTGALTATTATDNCDPNPTITCSLLTPTSSILITPQTQFPKGINNISCIARDNCGNTSTACTFTLTVVDNEKPTITCPLSISVVGTQTPPPTLCKAIVNGLAPTVTDNCPMWTVGYTISGATTINNGVNDASGTMFMQGISTVTYTVTDMGGNKATCSFTVTVRCETQGELNLTCGMAVVTCFSGIKNNTVDNTAPVIAIFDVRDASTATLGNNWATPKQMFSEGDAAHCGQVFGLAIDNSGSIFTTASTIFGDATNIPGFAWGPGGAGAIYKFTYTAGVWVRSLFVSLNNSGSGLGNITYDKTNNQFFVTNFQDGLIYRIPNVNTPIPVFYQPTLTTTFTSTHTNFIPLGKRLWGIGYNEVEKRVYFGRWNEDNGSRRAVNIHNEIWSVGFNNSGNLDQNTEKKEITISDFPELFNPPAYSNPVSDIEFSENGDMLIAEKVMFADIGFATNPSPGGWGHKARIFQFKGNSVIGWSPAQEIFIGNAVTNQNSAGGVDYGYKDLDSLTGKLTGCDSLVWGTGDALMYQGDNNFNNSPNYVYGIGAMPVNGNTPTPSPITTWVESTSIYVDLDNDLNNILKLQIGDVDIFNCPCPPKIDTCKCDTFANLNFRPTQGAPTQFIKCGETLTIGCNPNFNPVIAGSFTCSGTNCMPSMPIIHWELSQNGGSPFAQGNVSQSSSGFSLPLLASYFTTAGSYELTLSTSCNEKACPPCTFIIKTSGCPPSCCQNFEAFSQNVMNNVSLVVDKAKCKIALNIGNLPNCDMIQNINWGEGPIDFGPYMAGNMPMHSYTGSATYIISYLAVEKNPVNGAVCFEKLVRDTITLICNNTDTCRCLGFANMSFYNNTWQPVVKPAKCDSFYTLPCTTNGGLFFFHGNMLCSSKACLSDSVTWSIAQGNIKIASGTAALHMIGSLASGHFDITLNPALFTPGVAYTMTVTGKCGNQVCTCKINFNFAPCPCLCDNLKKDLLKGFKVVGSQPLTICKRTFMPIALCPNDVVTWTLNGVAVAGTTTGNNIKTITFPGSGIYTICMNVVRTETSGKVCEGKICQKVKVKCKIGGVDPNIAFCNDNKVLNGDFTEGAIAGHLDASGVISDWKLFPNIGDGFVFVDDSTGSGNAGHLVLNGGKANFGAVWQKVNLTPNTYTTLEYDFKNYLGESTPAGTVLEFRLEPDTLSGGPSQVLYTQSIKDTTMSWTSALLSVRVSPNQDYKYLIVCVRNDNDTSKSVIGLDNLVICTSNVSGIDQTSLLKKIHIFPNPNSGVFTVELPTPATSKMKLRVTDLTGRLLLEKQTEEGNSIQTVKASTLPDGLYFIQVISEGKVVAIEKLVKQ